MPRALNYVPFNFSFCKRTSHRSTKDTVRERERDIHSITSLLYEQILCSIYQELNCHNVPEQQQYYSFIESRSRSISLILGVLYEQVRSRLILRPPRTRHALCCRHARHPPRKHPVNWFQASMVDA